MYIRTLSKLSIYYCYIESSHVSIKSSRVSRVSSRDTMNTDGETWTKDVQPTTTAHNPDSPEEKTGIYVHTYLI